jgi:hypothetical protein
MVRVVGGIYVCVSWVFGATLQINVVRDVLRIFEILFRRDGVVCSVASCVSTLEWCSDV